MAIFPYRNPGAIGIIKDLPSHDLPPEAWSDGNNVRFRDGRVEKINGHASVYSGGVPPAGVHYILPNFQPDGEFQWILCGLTDAWKLDTGVDTEITRTGDDYAGTAADRWNGCIFGGVVIVNNGVDEPQQLEPDGVATKLTDLDFITGTSTWGNTNGTTAAGGSGMRCKVMRAFRDHLIALDITDLNLGAGVQRDPYKIWWSHAASAGSVPSSWDATDTSVDAGNYSLVSTQDYLVDCLPLGEINIVYKEQTLWAMRYVGPPRVFEFTRIPISVGMMAQECAVEFNNLHVVKTLDDFVVHNGSQVLKRVTDKSWRRWLQNNIDTDNYLKSFMVANRRQYEAWFCFPSSGNTYPDKALIWNWQDDKLSVRDIPSLTHMAEGIVDSDIDDSVATIGGTIDQLEGPYDIRFYDPISRNMMGAEYSASTAVLHQMDTGNTFAGSNMTCELKREGLPIGNTKAGKKTRKMLRRVYPYVDGTDGGVLQFRFGVSDNRMDEPTWGSWQDYTIGTTRFLDMRMAGFFISVNVRSTTDMEWQYDGFELDAVEIGAR